MSARLAVALLAAASPVLAEPVARFPEAPDPRAPPSSAPAPIAPPGGAAAASPAEARPLPMTSGSDALTERGRRLAAEGRIPDALVAYTEAVRLDARNGAALVELGRLRLRMGNAREAEQLFTRGATTADGAPALVERARLRQAQGRDIEAFADLQRAAELSPDDRVTVEELARSAARRRAWLPALAAWRRFAAETRDPEAARAARLRVAALRVMAADLDRVAGAPDDARTLTRRALATLSRR